MKKWYNDIEYNMPKRLADEFLKTRKGLERNVHPQEFLCRMVNENYNLLGNCTKVNVY